MNCIQEGLKLRSALNVLKANRPKDQKQKSSENYVSNTSIPLFLYKNGELIKKFKSKKEASNELNISRSAIEYRLRSGMVFGPGYVIKKHNKKKTFFDSKKHENRKEKLQADLSNERENEAKRKLFKQVQNEGYSLNEIADMAGITFNQLAYVMNKKYVKRGRPKTGMKESTKKIIKLLNDGKKPPEISKIMNCTKENIYMIRKNFC